MNTINTHIVKIGSNVLTADNHLDLNTIHRTARDVSEIVQTTGDRVIIVSSGAIACGRSYLGMPKTGRESIALKQALAAAGQPELMRVWKEAFATATPARKTAQVLLTRQNLVRESEWPNIIQMINAFNDHAIAIVNENDSVTDDQINFGDNDQLAAELAVAIDAQTLTLLTDVNGCFSGNPATDPSAHLLTQIDFNQLNDKYINRITHGTNGNGTGGMRSKLLAARIAAEGGVTKTFIANGKTGNSLKRIYLSNENPGTQVSLSTF